MGDNEVIDQCSSEFPSSMQEHKILIPALTKELRQANANQACHIVAVEIVVCNSDHLSQHRDRFQIPATCKSAAD
jgi:hypothetical protein